MEIDEAKLFELMGRLYVQNAVLTEQMQSVLRIVDVSETQPEEVTGDAPEDSAK